MEKVYEFMIKNIFIMKATTGELIFHKSYEDIFDVKLTSSFLSAIFSFVKQTLKTEKLSEIEVGAMMVSTLYKTKLRILAVLASLSAVSLVGSVIGCQKASMQLGGSATPGRAYQAERLTAPRDARTASSGRSPCSRLL